MSATSNSEPLMCASLADQRIGIQELANAISECSCREVGSGSRTASPRTPHCESRTFHKSRFREYYKYVAEPVLINRVPDYDKSKGIMV